MGADGPRGWGAEGNTSKTIGTACCKGCAIKKCVSCVHTLPEPPPPGPTGHGGKVQLLHGGQVQRLAPACAAAAAGSDVTGHCLLLLPSLRSALPLLEQNNVLPHLLVPPAAATAAAAGGGRLRAPLSREVRNLFRVPDRREVRACHPGRQVVVLPRPACDNSGFRQRAANERHRKQHSTIQTLLRTHRSAR